MDTCEPKIQLYIKANDYVLSISPDIISMREIMYVYFKNIPFQVVLVNLKNKKTVLSSTKQSLKLPLMGDIERNVIMEDFINIEDYLDTNFPEPSLDCDISLKEIVPDIYKHFLLYIKSLDNSFLKRFLSCVDQIEKQLLKSNGKYLNGEFPTVSDCIIFPKLYQFDAFCRLANLPSFPDTAELTTQYVAHIKSIEKLQVMLPNDLSLKQLFLSKGAPNRIFVKTL